MYKKSTRETELLIFGEPILLLQLDDLFLLLLGILLLRHLGLLVIEDDEVAIGDVEAGEMVDRSLGVVDVLVDNEGCAASVLVGAQPDLADCSILAEDVVHLLARDVEREVAHVKHTVHLRRKPSVPLPQAYRRH